MSLQYFNPSVPIDLEELVTILLPDIYEAVRWACLRYQSHIRQDEFNDLSQQVVLKLIEDDCRLLRSFKQLSSFTTWLQAVVNRHVYKHVRQRKQTENYDEVDQGALICSPPQEGEIYATEKQKLLVRAFGMLSEQERLFYQLCYVSEMKTQDIAAVFKIDVENVYKRKHMLFLKLTRIVQTIQNY